MPFPSRFILLFCLLTSTIFAQTGFQTKSFSLPGGQEFMSTADFNHDGRPDLLLTGGLHPAIMLNTGGGNFAAPVDIDTTIFNFGGLAADFNGDGIPDVVGCGTDALENAFLIIYLNDGAGHFTRSESIPMGHGCNGIQVGDVNHDGKMDVLTGTVTTWFGDGAGHLVRSVSQTLNVNPVKHPEITGCFASGVLAGHFLTDGTLDLLITGVCNNPPGQATIDYGTLYFGHGDNTGHFVLSEVFEADVTWDFTGAAVDVNHDGRLDALLTHRLNQKNNAQVLYALDVAFNQGSGHFAVTDIFNLDATTTPNNTFVFSGGAADFDRDGLPEVAVAFEKNSAFGVAIVDGELGNVWNIAQQWSLPGISFSTVSADFNRDGRPDLATIAINPDLTGTLFVYLNEMVAACSTPASPGVHVCAPLAGHTYTSPVAMIGAGRAANGSVSRMELWIDGHKIANFPGNEINTPVSLPAGNHSATMVEVDTTGAFIKSAPVTFTVH